MSITGSAAAGIGSITEVLNYWAEIGVFAYVLPFLLIFAVVYGILSRMNVLGEAGKNKGVNAVISVAIGLISLQFDIVTNFFATIFPYTGVGLSILLVFLILGGLLGVFEVTGGKMHWTRTMFIIIGLVIAIFVVFNSLTDTTAWASGMWWSEYAPSIITLAIIGLLVWAVVGGKGEAGDGGEKKQ